VSVLINQCFSVTSLEFLMRLPNFYTACMRLLRTLRHSAMKLYRTNCGNAVGGSLHLETNRLNEGLAASSCRCPNKSATFNFVINAPFIKKVLVFLFQYTAHILRSIVEHIIRQMSPATLLSLGGRQCAHFKYCALVGTSHTYIRGLEL